MFRLICAHVSWALRFVVLAFAFGFTPSWATDTSFRANTPLQRLTVQLSWTHQTQFAGFYMAQRSGHFAREGLDVVLLPGNASINPIDGLHGGVADVAISTLGGALARSDVTRPVTNIAQIFQTSPILVMCRPSLGVASAEDILGKKVGVSGGGDVQVLKAIQRRLRPDAPALQTVPRDESGRMLIQGDAPCITGVTFNELLRVQNSGIPESDLLILQPQNYGIADFGDGLYVDSTRLKDPAFRTQLVGLLRALDKGWRQARDYRALAVEATLERNPLLDTQFQFQALEQVLELIPARDFGLLQLEPLEVMAAQYASESVGKALPTYAWTHDIYNEWQRADGKAKGMTPSTRHELQAFASHPLFYWMVTIGTLMFGLGGALLAIERGYNVWGRLLVAFLPAIGGGTLRDLLIGGPRLPLYFIADPSIPIALLVIVLLTSVVVTYRPELRRTQGFAKTMQYSDILGSAVIATNGAIVALLADVPWVWVPFFAALSCAGGGLLLDVMTSEPPRAFRGRIFEDEERGVISGLILLAALWVANSMHQPLTIVYLGAMIAVLVNLWLYRARSGLERWYPAWLRARV
jgi:NitT/TauT family transport system substrate-binding protein